MRRGAKYFYFEQRFNHKTLSLSQNPEKKITHGTLILILQSSDSQFTHKPIILILGCHILNLHTTYHRSCNRAVSNKSRV